MPSPVIALLTDFGLADHYVGTMKGVILSICPEATLVDLTHGIAPQDVRAGALQLAASVGYFPAGTIVVAVVDPGVGSSRRALAAEAGPHRFVAPDNGLLDGVFSVTPPTQIVELTDARFALPQVSRTFEGRDRFAPAAAWLARGTALAALGPVTTSWTRLDLAAAVEHDDRVTGVVAWVDRFGNLVTTIRRAQVERVFAGGQASIAVAGRPVSRLVGTFADASPAEVCALFGSSGHLEVFVRNGSAAAVLAVGAGAETSVQRTVC